MLLSLYSISTITDQNKNSSMTRDNPYIEYVGWLLTLSCHHRQSSEAGPKYAPNNSSFTRVGKPIQYFSLTLYDSAMVPCSVFGFGLFFSCFELADSTALIASTPHYRQTPLTVPKKELSFATSHLYFSTHWPFGLDAREVQTDDGPSVPQRQGIS